MRLAKAQIGIEMMAIVAVMMLLLLPLTYILLVRGGQFNEQVAIAKSDENAARIAATANSVGRMGPGSKVVLQVDSPEGIIAAGAIGGGSAIDAEPWGELSFRLRTSYGEGDVVSMSDFPLTPGPLFDSLQLPGTHYIAIEALSGGTVQIGSAMS
ncbi:MAG: hypothetical protein Q7T16_04805 [Candidatus Burarchaeum sp.]|nr:hypothetical protein [Candidatus Burarchaeum sp.]MDO8339949.1 hypothetical protein [Candidatus Burarchaeum sp.]